LRRLLPALPVLLGAAAGAVLGLVLRDPAGASAPAPAPGEVARDYVRLNNQFVVPVIEGGEVGALVILSLSIEAVAGASEAVYAREPRLRDAFLRVMFDHANAGGFAGAFTAGGALELLRAALRETARAVLGDIAIDVLIVDIARQDA